MPKRARGLIDASKPLSRDRTADMLKKLRGLNKEARMLKVSIQDAKPLIVHEQDRERKDE
jgi:hypothetical protein